jgi:hypothetical protein
MKNVDPPKRPRQLFPELKFMAQVATKMSWPNILEILSLQEAVKTDFQLTMALLSVQ